MNKNFLKINIEDYLHAIDSALAGKTQKDIYMTYIMVVASIFAFAYLFFWDSSVAEFEQTRQEVSRLKSKISQDELFLRRNPEIKIKKLDEEIQRINKELVIHKDNNAYIKRKIETIASLIYDERTWGEYLDSISYNAQRYHVKIRNFNNKYAENNSSFGHILDISIASSGNFKNTLRFINSLEQSDLVVDIHDLSIKAQDRLNSELNISVWGITY